MYNIEEENKIFRVNTINLLFNIFQIFLCLTGITYLFSYFIGNKLIYKNNKIRKQFEFTPYIEGISIFSLVITIISLLSIFLIYYEIDLIC
jgi:hypothetical protein